MHTTIYLHILLYTYTYHYTRIHTGPTISARAPPVAQLVENPPAMQETRVQSLGWDDPPEKGMAAYSSILAWSQRVRHDCDSHRELNTL